ncbi:hypothetical protein DUNSADRAFT_107 [Dunaliella salina]|uniref:Uncharacterized protein n=1 Tax=Dunaliella salina TaxID=3046 RepID=A0ABQ7H907_DUNSA|nr:hypothetical protein DUNSADRAFT_107 [Dunaliella salina]|eukprot:KAF5843305.1 hypothetical protein DUNSADRAFT_107 [Dunaliella salina]
MNYFLSDNLNTLVLRIPGIGCPELLEANVALRLLKLFDSNFFHSAASRLPCLALAKLLNFYVLAHSYVPSCFGLELHICCLKPHQRVLLFAL